MDKPLLNGTDGYELADDAPKDQHGLLIFSSNRGPPRPGPHLQSGVGSSPSSLGHKDDVSVEVISLLRFMHDLRSTAELCSVLMLHKLKACQVGWNLIGKYLRRVLAQKAQRHHLTTLSVDCAAADDTLYTGQEIQEAF